MLTRPAGVAEGELLSVLDDEWGVGGVELTYLPLGSGSYHWSAVGRDGRTWFVKVDDVGLAEDEFVRLSNSQATALALRRDAGVDFVLAPVPTANDAPVHRLSPRYALTLFPFVEGVAGRFGPHPREHLPEITALLAALHNAARQGPRTDLALAERPSLQTALAEVEEPWTAGPHSEAARRLLARHQDRVRQWLARYDELADDVGAGQADWVITHGEPHSGNFLRTADGFRLIDWTTAQIAPAERDLWMLTDAFPVFLGENPYGTDHQVLAQYTQATGRIPDPAAFALYRLTWPLADVAAFLNDLRRPHQDDADTAAALRYLAGNLETV